MGGRNESRGRASSRKKPRARTHSTKNTTDHTTPTPFVSCSETQAPKPSPKGWRGRLNRRTSSLLDPAPRLPQSLKRRRQRPPAVSAAPLSTAFPLHHLELDARLRGGD